MRHFDYHVTCFRSHAVIVRGKVQSQDCFLVRKALGRSSDVKFDHLIFLTTEIFKAGVWDGIVMTIYGSWSKLKCRWIS